MSICELHVKIKMVPPSEDQQTGEVGQFHFRQVILVFARPHQGHFKNVFNSTYLGRYLTKLRQIMEDENVFLLFKK